MKRGHTVIIPRGLARKGTLLRALPARNPATLLVTHATAIDAQSQRVVPGTYEARDGKFALLAN